MTIDCSSSTDFPDDWDRQAEGVAGIRFRRPESPEVFWEAERPGPARQECAAGLLSAFYDRPADEVAKLSLHVGSKTVCATKGAARVPYRPVVDGIAQTSDPTYREGSEQRRLKGDASTDRAQSKGTLP